MTCTVAVTRTNTGAEAPAASLAVATSNSYDNSVSGISYTFNDTLLWPAIDNENPANPQTETQVINFVIDNNNIHDEDMEVTITLAHNTDEIITQDTAVLSIEDVTEPAVVTITRNKEEINEGDTVSFTVTRTENSATEFDVNYTSTLVPAMINNFDHYFDISGSNGKESGVLSFTKGGVNTQTLTFNSIVTIENNPDFTLNLLLGVDAINNHIVGLGDLSAADTGSNTTDASTLVKNRRDLIVDNYSVIIEDKSTGRTVPNFTYGHSTTTSPAAYTAQNVINVPTSRTVDITLTVPAGLHIDNGASYTWTLRNPDGTNATWSDGVVLQTNPNGLFEINRTGNLMYDAAGVNRTADYSITTKLNLPFVSEDTAFKLVLDINGNTEIFSKAIDFTVKPLWRELQVNRNSRCLGVGSGTDGLRNCGSAGTWADLQWAWNPANLTLLNKDVGKYGANRCMNLNGTTVSAATCVANDTNQKINIVPEEIGRASCRE